MYKDSGIRGTVTCLNCMFFDKQSDNFGLCRLVPPRLVMPSDNLSLGLSWEHPTVHIKDWCGQYKWREG